MIVSLNWLKKYVDLEGIPVDDIIEKLTASGLEVEEVTDRTKDFENFVVGYVKEKKKHPNADKLSVCTVNDGEKDLNIVCGAPNVDSGQNIILAKVGAVIPGADFKIKKAKLRGEVSEGMICSEKELGIGDNHEGIMVLGEGPKPGTPAAEALGLDDITIEVAITPNRPDALSHIGIARDLAALYRKSLIMPSVKLEESDKPSEELASIEIEDPVKCPRYTAKVVRNVKITESPEWLKKHLMSIGQRPINNIVDVTNFILHEVGQPLHAFDLDKLAGKKLVIKTAGEKKKFVTLDSKERELKADDLMICDGEKEVAVAGVMGGENSEVTEDTVNILIESAYFNPSSVRKTSKHLGLSTDASYRFERGCNPEITAWAARRAAQLIVETGGGEIAKGEIDVTPNKLRRKNVILRYSRIGKILGTEVDEVTTDIILQALGFVIVNKENGMVYVDIPGFRPDVEREIDLIEEVARIYGYDNIPVVDHVAVSLDEKEDSTALKDKIRGILNGLGSSEIVTNSLLNKKTAEKFGGAIGVLNPQSKEMSHLRPSLVPGLLFTIAKNLKVREKNLNLFEIGHIFRGKSDTINSFEDFEENTRITLAITGKAVDTAWYSGDRNYDFYDLKGLAEEFLGKFYLDNELAVSYHKAGNSLLEYGYSCSFKGKVIAEAGKVKEEIVKFFDIDQEVFIIDLDYDALAENESETKKFNELLKYPKVVRDFAFILDKDTDTGDVVETIRKTASELLKNIRVFDIFEGKSLDEGKKSVAFQLEYYDISRTLTEEEIDEDFWKTIEKVKIKFNALLRGK